MFPPGCDPKVLYLDLDELYGMKEKLKKEMEDEEKARLTREPFKYGTPGILETATESWPKKKKDEILNLNDLPMPREDEQSDEGQVHIR